MPNLLYDLIFGQNAPDLQNALKQQAAELAAREKWIKMQGEQALAQEQARLGALEREKEAQYTRERTSKQQDLRALGAATQLMLTGSRPQGVPYDLDMLIGLMTKSSPEMGAIPINQLLAKQAIGGMPYGEQLGAARAQAQIAESDTARDTSAYRQKVIEDQSKNIAQDQATQRRAAEATATGLERNNQWRTVGQNALYLDPITGKPITAWGERETITTTPITDPKTGKVVGGIPNKTSIFGATPVGIDLSRARQAAGSTIPGAEPDYEDALSWLNPIQEETKPSDSIFQRWFGSSNRQPTTPSSSSPTAPQQATPGLGATPQVFEELRNFFPNLNRVLKEGNPFIKPRTNEGAINLFPPTRTPSETPSQEGGSFKAEGFSGGVESRQPLRSTFGRRGAELLTAPRNKATPKATPKAQPQKQDMRQALPILAALSAGIPYNAPALAQAAPTNMVYKADASPFVSAPANPYLQTIPQEPVTWQENNPERQFMQSLIATAKYGGLGHLFSEPSASPRSALVRPPPATREGLLTVPAAVQDYTPTSTPQRSVGASLEDMYKRIMSGERLLYPY